MRPVTAPSVRRTAGFSLIELMVALVAGMVVVGAVLAFTVSSVRANADYVGSARLMQELRSVSQYVNSELRRAGYDEDSMAFLASSTTQVSEFAPMLVDTTAGANCVIYAYDRLPGTTGEIDLDNQELRGVRRSTVTMDGVQVGVIEMAESAAGLQPACAGAGPDYSKYPVMCNAATGWCPLSDPRIVAIDTFIVDIDGVDANADGVPDASHGRQELSSVGSGYMPMQIREARVTVGGHLRSDDDVDRSIVSNVKIRANCLRALISECNAAPTP